MKHTREALRAFSRPEVMLLAGVLTAWALDWWLSASLPFCHFYGR